MRRHVATEAKVRAAIDRRAIVRLSGEFHILLAEMADNSMLTKTMRELAVLTCLIIYLYDTPANPACPYHEHDQIIDAIEGGDARKAVDVMLRHLDHVESSRDLRVSFPAIPDLAAALT